MTLVLQRVWEGLCIHSNKFLWYLIKTQGKKWKSLTFKSVQSWKKCTPSTGNLYNCHPPNCSLSAWIEIGHFVPKSINGQGSLVSNKFCGLVRGPTYSFPKSTEQHHFVREDVLICAMYSGNYKIWLFNIIEILGSVCQL